MKKITRALLLLFIPFYFISCNYDPSIPPEFKDGNATVDQLKSQWKCEAIEFENWEEDDPVDSSLTICLINSKSVPDFQTDGSRGELEKIASQIRSSLSKPEKYRSYYVVFLEQEGIIWRSRVHKYGGEVLVEAL